MSRFTYDYVRFGGRFHALTDDGSEIVKEARLIISSCFPPRLVRFGCWKFLPVLTQQEWSRVWHLAFDIVSERLKRALKEVDGC